ncbi:MAG: rRNA pseudouridine synthase [Firmicutes bacterium]|nr:rRNA pseudouridine synthase [Bacillota bacterium]MCL5064748.1 rRNA pseudouridine synthase [Bacillota bacterium]
MAESAIRIQRVIQMAGLASRRTAEAWIQNGRVKVNGLPATVGQLVDPLADKVLVDGRPLPTGRAHAYWMVNKPEGYTCSLKDRHAEHLVTELVPKQQGRLYPVGRLDRDSQGLLLMTNDGSLAFKLSHPRYQIPKVYEVWVEGTPRRHRLDRIERGIQLEDGMARPASVALIRSEGAKSLLRIVMTEGKKREIRRLMTTVGHPVVALTRVAYANLSLAGLATGQARPLTHREILDLEQFVNQRDERFQEITNGGIESKKPNRVRSTKDRGRQGKSSPHPLGRGHLAISTRPSRHSVGNSRRNRSRPHR